MQTEAQIKALSTGALIALYNKLTGKTIKKFSSRAAGEKQVLAAQERLGKLPEAAAPAALATPRKVRGTASAAVGAGRPKESYEVELTEKSAKSTPNNKSLRRQLITWMSEVAAKAKADDPKATGRVTIERIERKFDRPMRGVVNKLKAKRWLNVVPAAEA